MGRRTFEKRIITWFFSCVEVDIVVHELMHAIGLWHEHMRYDRDDYIKVHYENIDPGNLLALFFSHLFQFI